MLLQETRNVPAPQLCRKSDVYKTKPQTHSPRSELEVRHPHSLDFRRKSLCTSNATLTRTQHNSHSLVSAASRHLEIPMRCSVSHRLDVGVTKVGHL